MTAFTPAGALGQTASGAGPTDRLSFSIPPQPLATALVNFSRIAGVDVIGDGGIGARARSPGAVGVMTRAEAMRRLTEGTGAEFRFTDATTVTLEAPEAVPMAQETSVPLEEINVEGDGRGTGESAFGRVDGYVATRSATGSKTDAPLIEIPQTINVVTADQIQAQGAQSVSEALRYTPGVRTEGYGASSPFDVYTQVRGFRADLYLDGLRLPTGGIEGTASGVVDPWALERLEVLKGPASGLYGQAGPGGIINMVTKRPTETPVREVQVQRGSFDRVQGAFDFGGPIDDGAQLLYRVTGLARSSGTQLDFADNDRAFIAPSLTWRPNDDTSFTVLGMYQRDRSVWSYFNYMPAIGSLDAFNGRKISTHRYLGEPDFDRMKRDQASIGYEFEHRFNETVSFKQNLRYNHTEFSYRGAITGNGSNLSGDGEINRSGIQVQDRAKTFAVDNRIKVDVTTGPFVHDAVVGLDYRRETATHLFTEGAVPSLNVFNPRYNSGPISIDDNSIQNYRSTLDQVGVYAQDRIKLGQWVATLGGRYDRAKSTLDNAVTTYAPASRSDQNDGAFSGRAGLTYLFESGISPYVSYATSFQPQTGNDAITTKAFKPSEGRQFEAGVKYQPPGTKTLITVAAFDLTQTNRVTSDDQFRQRQIGEVNVKGIEFEAKSEVLQNLNVIASYAYLDHKITKSANSDEVGYKLFSTPNHQASLWGDYGFVAGPLSGLTIGAGVRYIGSTADASNTLDVPAVTLFDAQIKLDLEKVSSKLAGASLAVNASNIFDKKYVSQCDGDTMCTYGTRRAVLATLNYKW